MGQVVFQARNLARRWCACGVVQRKRKECEEAERLCERGLDSTSPERHPLRGGSLHVSSVSSAMIGDGEAAAERGHQELSRCLRIQCVCGSEGCVTRVTRVL